MVDEPQLLDTSPGDPELSQIHWFPLGSAKRDQEPRGGQDCSNICSMLAFSLASRGPRNTGCGHPTTPVTILLGKEASVTPCGSGLKTAHSSFEERGR